MYRVLFIYILTVFICFEGQAQVLDPNPASDSLPERPLMVDTTIQGVDTVPEATTIRISKDSLSSKVDYGCQDSMIFDNVNKLIHLFGQAYVNYESLKLTAAYIKVNIDSNIAYAQAGRDTLDHLVGVPEFIDGAQKFNAMKMRYNFKTKRGMVYEALTKEGDILVRGAKTKYVSNADTTNGDDHIFNENAIFTTCDHPEPHFGIRSRKQKLVPNKLVVTGPSIVEIGGVPTPLILPFAFFPLAKGKRSGLIFPRDYEYSQQWGFGLRELGYYIPINDYMDLRVLGDIYFSGTWGITARSTYVKKYGYRGNLEMAYGDRVQEFSGDYRKQHQKSFKVIWSHNQDSKSNPFHNFSARVNFQLNRYDQLNRNDAASVLNNTIRSNITYRRTFQDKPYTLTMALTHSQNQNTRDINISFPELRFNVRQFQPFKRKNNVGSDKWYENIGMTYTFETKSRYNTKDSLFLQDVGIEDIDYGARHNFTLNSNTTVLKYLRFNTSVKFNEYWHFRQLQKDLDPTIVLDTLSMDTSANGVIITEVDSILGTVVSDTLYKFTPFHDFSMTAGFSTKLFGTARFKGKLRGLRHVLTPSVNFNYSPNYRNENYGYWKSVSTSTGPDPVEQEEYSIFLNNVAGAPNVGEERLAMSFRLENNFEAKYFSKSDSSEKNVKLLDRISVNADYNFARDSFQWSMVNMSTFTKMFGGMTNVQIGARFDPYAVEYDENGMAKRIQEYAWNKNRNLLRFERADLNITTRFTLRQISDVIGGLFGKKPKGNPSIQGPPPPPQTPIDPVSLGPGVVEPEANIEKNKKGQESLFDLFANFSINHSIRFALTAQESGDTLVINNNYIEMTGALKLTDNWNIGFSRIGYNFKQKVVTYPDLSFTRDLHCWQLSFSWQPVYGTYSLYLGVKPGSLDFLKVPYRRNNVDTFFQ